MFNNQKVLALIPARAGSKRLPGKNIQLFAGHPLINWTIDQAKKSFFIDRVVVSTDSEEIIAIAKQKGALVPFKRPAALATDNASSIDVIYHALDFLSANGEQYEYVVLLQPTSPLRIAADIDGAIGLLGTTKGRAVVSVCKAEHDPRWTIPLPIDGSLKDFLKQREDSDVAQERKVYYRLNGAIYIADVEYLKKNGGFIGEGAYAYIMPPQRSIDIDTELDFRLAEYFYDRSNNEKNIPKTNNKGPNFLNDSHHESC